MVRHDPSIHPPNFLKEKKMSKLEIRGVLSVFVLFIAVAVFSSVVQVRSRNVERQCLPASQSKGAGILIADGGDPVPPPSPLPWPKKAA